MHKQNVSYLKNLHFVFLSVHVSVFFGKLSMPNYGCIDNFGLNICALAEVMQLI